MAGARYADCDSAFARAATSSKPKAWASSGAARARPSATRRSQHGNQARAKAGVDVGADKITEPLGSNGWQDGRLAAWASHCEVRATSKKSSADKDLESASSHCRAA